MSTFLCLPEQERTTPAPLPRGPLRWEELDSECWVPYNPSHPHCPIEELLPGDVVSCQFRTSEAPPAEASLPDGSTDSAFRVMFAVVADNPGHGASRREHLSSPLESIEDASRSAFARAFVQTHFGLPVVPRSRRVQVLARHGDLATCLYLANLIGREAYTQRIYNPAASLPLPRRCEDGPYPSQACAAIDAGLPGASEYFSKQWDCEWKMHVLLPKSYLLQSVALCQLLPRFLSWRATHKVLPSSNAAIPPLQRLAQEGETTHYQLVLSTQAGKMEPPGLHVESDAASCTAAFYESFYHRCPTPPTRPVVTVQLVFASPALD